jgi:hypothetical protein
MSGLTVMLAAWGVLTIILIGLIIYRSILSDHEEDQLFLSRGEAALESEQAAVVKQMNRLDPLVRWLSIASGGLLLLIVAWWLYQGLFAAQVIE